MATIIKMDNDYLLNLMFNVRLNPIMLRELPTMMKYDSVQCFQSYFQCLLIVRNEQIPQESLNKMQQICLRCFQWAINTNTKILFEIHLALDKI